MKKIFLLAFSAVIALGILCSVDFTSLAVQSENKPKTQFEGTDTYYSFDASTKTLTISGEGATPDFDSDNKSQPWYMWRSDGSIQHVIVEEGITSLGKYFFYYVSAEDFLLPSTLTSLGNYSMSGVNSLKSITLPQNLTTIGNYAFYYSTTLESVSIPSSVTSIGTSAFENCSSLNSVSFEDLNASLTIGKRAFFACSSLKSITVPKRATLSSYSLGFYSASKGSVYKEFVMNVYRDSPAYTYAVNNIVNYNIINEMEIKEGQSIACTYYANSFDDDMIFVFTPTVSSEYRFYSSGMVDVDCVLTDSNGKELASHDDNSPDDLGFTVDYNLNAGKTYYYTVKSIRSTGEFTVNLYSKEIESIELDIPAELSCDDNKDGKFDILSLIEGREITVIHKTGYTKKISFTNNMQCFDMTVSYTDDQDDEEWLCGEHAYTISVGEYSKDFTVIINHSYTATIIPPTLTEEGYTEYTCVFCSDRYKADFVKRTGVLVSGKVLLMESPDGSHPHNLPIVNAVISLDGENITQTDINGEFEFYAVSDSSELRIFSDFAVDRVFEFAYDENMEMNLGDISFFHLDYNEDGYVNAKDFALLRGIYGEYPKEVYDDFITVDYNQDGTIDYEDFKYAKNFFTYGKITESIYD
ncbi:MAG: leucine-rich repeat protein [Eubacterium sp.]|nr:leucine-rich repeat protein [Eubacterium sp.]